MAAAMVGMALKIHLEKIYYQTKYLAPIAHSNLQYLRVFFFFVKLVIKLLK